MMKESDDKNISERTEAKTRSILLAEDSAIYRRLIGDHLTEWGFEFECVKDGKEAWNLLGSQNPPRLALLDWILPEIDGVDLCRRLRQKPETEPYTYTILLTAKNRKQEMLEAMDAGVDDFLVKPFDPLELKARLLVGKRIVALQEKLVSANDALHLAASHDFLTGVWNRSAIVAFLQRELAHASRSGSSVGIVLIDVDHFKRVNDEFGHEAGDSVLMELSRRLTSGLREYDGVGRYGGEEFLLVLPGCDESATARRANQIREMISSRQIATHFTALNITISMGAIVARMCTDPELLLRSADAALYQAKRNGRNRLETAESTGTQPPCNELLQRSF